MYSREDIIRGIKQASKEVTDDCQMAGVLTAGANILGISEDEVNALICEDNIEYITFDVVRRIWNDYAVGFEYPDGSDVMCQDSGWTLGAAEQSVGLGRFFVEKPLTGRWSYTANPVGGEMLYAVYRLKDITKVDCSGNRELLTTYYPDKEMCVRLADELIARHLRDYDECASFALKFVEGYGKEDVKDKSEGSSFLDDQCKMVDFFMLSRADFMNEYSYLNEDDYDQTCYDILARSGYENVDAIDPSAMTSREIYPIIDAIQKQEWLLSRGGEKNA